MLVPWLLCGVLAVLLAVLCTKLLLVQASICEICAGLSEHLSRDTNVLLCVSSADRHVKKLAATLNSELRLLQKERRRYQNADHELKKAVTNISHDLRTPLTAICGYLELLQREETTKAAARYLALVENRVQALTMLTEEMFRYSVALSTSDEVRLAPVDVNSLLEESIAAFYAAFTLRGIVPTIHLCSVRVRRSLNADAVARVFSNLFNNALKYSAGDLEITLRESGEIIFSNTAPGLSEVEVGKLFNRFFSVETAGDATGLGLAIAKTLVEQMHGTITAQYAEKKLHVCIVFPAGEKTQA